MAVLQRTELDQSPLADLHAIASELGIEGFRRLRREELIAVLLAGQGASPEAPAATDAAATEAPAATESEATEAPSPARRARRSTRSASRRRSARAADRDEDAAPPPRGTAEPKRQEAVPAERETTAPAERPSQAQAPAEPEPVEEARSGMLELLANGGGLLRAAGGGPSPDDPYVSPAQIRRLELRPGDEVAGPVRPPQRSERYPALVRIESVNGADGEAGVGRKRFEELTPVWPSERLAAPKEVDRAPFGKGSRVAVGGEPGTGATTLLRALVETLGERQPELERTVLLAGVRPEELGDWRREVTASAVAGGAFDRTAADLAAIAELAIERAKRAVEQGRDVLMAIDSLEFLPEDVALRVFGAGRRVEEGGSLTVIAVTGSSDRMRRLATTRIVLDAGRGGRSPGSLVPGASGTTRADLLT